MNNLEQLQVERRPIGELLPYARNARTHSDAQVAQIAASMTEFGCARASRRCYILHLGKGSIHITPQ